jgi:hypothetical protein
VCVRLTTRGDRNLSRSTFLTCLERPAQRDRACLFALSTGGDSGSSFVLHENQQRRGESERRGSGTAFVKERVVHATKMVVGKFEQEE